MLPFIHLDVVRSLQVRFGKKIYNRENDNSLAWGYLIGLCDAAVHKNEKCVNVVINPTIVLPPTSKTPVKPAAKTTLDKARREAKENVTNNVRTRIRSLRKKKT